MSHINYYDDGGKQQDHESETYTFGEIRVTSGEWGEKVTPMDIVNKYYERMNDPVNKPAHYNTGGIECIDYIKQTLGDEGFKAYCLGNTIKYLHRHKYKGKPKEDLQKAEYYLKRAIETYE